MNHFGNFFSHVTENRRFKLKLTIMQSLNYTFGVNSVLNDLSASVALRLMTGFTLCVEKTRPALTWPIVPRSGDMGFRCGATEPDRDFNLKKSVFAHPGPAA